MSFGVCKESSVIAYAGIYDHRCIGQWNAIGCFGGQRNLDCLDVYSASGRVASAWKAQWYNAKSIDVKSNKNHDVTSYDGFKLLLHEGLSFPSGMFMIFHDFSCFVINNH